MEFCPCDHGVHLYLLVMAALCLFIFIYLFNFLKKREQKEKKNGKEKDGAPHGVHYVSHFIPCFFMKGERK